MWRNRSDETSILVSSGAPTAQAERDTLCFDRTNNVMYSNTDGGTTWVAVAPATTTRPYRVRTWDAVTATSGTDTACTSDTAYVGAVVIPAPCTVTGVSYLVGSVGGTDKVVAALWSQSGALLANSATAGATVGTAAQIQAVALTATCAITSPGVYFIGVCFNGTTAKFRTIPAYTQGGAIGNSVTQTFGTPAAFTPPTTFTADKVPVAFIY